VESARAELVRLAQERPALAGPAAVLGEVLPALFAEPVREAPPGNGAAAKLAGGVPLLRGEQAVVEDAAFRRRWLAVCAALQNHRDSQAARALAAALREGRLTPAELVGHVLAGRPEQVHARAAELGLDAGLAATVLRLTLYPVLAQWRSALRPHRAGADWGRGYCPTCGGWPLLGEFRGLEQQRLLRCGLCADEWEFGRPRCPFCDNGDPQSLGYLHAEGEEGKCRADTCDVCRGYVKTVSTLRALDTAGLLVTDLATVHLDLAAAERGYLPAG
jgi:FdhE protein